MKSVLPTSPLPLHFPLEESIIIILGIVVDIIIISIVIAVIIIIFIIIVIIMMTIINVIVIFFKWKISTIWLVACIFLIFLIVTPQISMECEIRES